MIVPVQVLRNCGAQESDSTAATELFMAVSGGGGGGYPEGHPEVHDLHCFKHVKLQVVKTPPDSCFSLWGCNKRLKPEDSKLLITYIDTKDKCHIVQ